KTLSITLRNGSMRAFEVTRVLDVQDVQSLRSVQPLRSVFSDVLNGLNGLNVLNQAYPLLGSQRVMLFPCPWTVILAVRSCQERWFGFKIAMMFRENSARKSLSVNLAVRAACRAIFSTSIGSGL